ncbi:hypothetical protein DPMN_053964 [Dreissena polymorpha]|uniref:Uncharacterized protein n=1 Tax=Dreissena polymorpha TaxID=45954 RepID=A0A9D4HQT0_DREPO|nr:hypothetical protein DPMN_053964 [Dreissena polymorpha]
MFAKRGYCLSQYIGVKVMYNVRVMSPWLCMLCTMYSENTHGDLIPRLNWPQAMVSFYTEHLAQPGQVLQIADDLPPLIGPKQRLRVLSLCDGVAATLVALQTLCVDMETYYACETDPAAIQVVQFQQPNCVTNIGSVYDLNKEKLKTLLPLHLVVCNLPGEDCDVNHDPDTGGFNGGGVLACKLLLILKDITVLQGLQGEPLWLLTTPATLTTHITKQLTQLFQIGPSLWDAGWFSPLHCPVLVWGNLPNIHSSCQYADSSQESQTLDSCLVRSLNRTARVPKLRLCAVIKQGKQPVLENKSEATEEPVDDVGAVAADGIRSNMQSSSASFSYPVLMDNKPCGIWTIEIERAIGLPEHYTDISRLGSKERVCLLKQTPSVVLLTHLMQSLTQRFALKQE